MIKFFKLIIRQSRKGLRSISKNIKRKRYFKILMSLKQGDIAIDCGANVGEVTEKMASGGATVYAFEPNPLVFEILSSKFKDFKNVECIQKGLWDKESTIKFFCHQKTDEDEIKYSTGSSIYENKSNVNKEKFFEAQIIDLTDFITKLNSKIKFIKIDVEGAEYDIINKIIDLDLHKKIGNILVETHAHKIPELKEKANIVTEKIKAKRVKNIHMDWI